MTVHDAERLARLALGPRVHVDRTRDGWLITQWGLSDSGHKQERTIGQHPEWEVALRQAIHHRRVPWSVALTLTPR